MRLKPKRSRSELIVDVESLIGVDDEVRLIDDFVEKLDLASYKIGYKTAREWGKDKGGPSEYDPKDFIRIYLYGYLNKVRSSRDLEAGCKKNIDLIWLVKGQKPSHSTISNFRRDNPAGLLEIFKTLNVLWQSLGLFSEEATETTETPKAENSLEDSEQSDSSQTFAVDGSKFRGQNSKSRNYNKEKLEKNLERYDKKATAYLKELAELDGDLKQESDPIDIEQKNEKKSP